MQLRRLAQGRTQHRQTTTVVASLLPSLISTDAGTIGGQRSMRRTYFLVGGADISSIVWTLVVAVVCGALVVVGLILLAKGMGV